jgi:hypothetical protein
MQFIQGKNSVGQGRNAGLQFHVTSIPPEKISDVNVKHQASLIIAQILNTSASPATGLLDLVGTSGALGNVYVAIPSLVVNDNQAAKMQRKHGICLCPFVWVFIYEHDHPVVPFLLERKRDLSSAG